MPDFFKRLRGGRRTAAKQQGDVHALDRPGDPRGGVQTPEYRQADPREIVEDGGLGVGSTEPAGAEAAAGPAPERVAMSGPGGAPQEDASPEERRAADRREG
jgi:hypothetical protein